MESFGNLQAQQGYATKQIVGSSAQYSDRIEAPVPNESVSGVTEESISGMNRLCSELQAIADRTTGPQRSPMNGVVGQKEMHEPSIKDRARILRGLVYQANELTARIAQNLL